jgi:diguanylate cyclase (GGDEF)-like protein
MVAAVIPANESARLGALRALHVLDTLPEERFDRLTRLAKRMFGVPIALVSLVDANRQWFKSREGIDVSETPREVSFCAHAILSDDLLEVRDARDDGRFADNPAVTNNPGIRFYAGQPLTVGSGMRVGTLCLADMQPRELTDEDRAILHDLARMAEEELTALHTATMDSLTGLTNRRGIEILGSHVLSICQRLGMPATLMLMDIDRFKSINDTYGHHEGDAALKEFAETLRGTLRDCDVVGRLGGDEFVVIMSNAGPDDAEAVRARIVEACAQANRSSKRPYLIEASIGAVSVDATEVRSLEALLEAADKIMYENKRVRRDSRNGGKE